MNLFVFGPNYFPVHPVDNGRHLLVAELCPDDYTVGGPQQTDVLRRADGSATPIAHQFVHALRQLLLEAFGLLYVLWKG